MQPRQLKIGIARFPYSGNGGTASEHPSIGSWLATTVSAIKKDDRCEDGIWQFVEADTPITMVRNLALKEALANDVDVLIMVDSDQRPDLLVGHEEGAQRFWNSSFDFLCEHFDRGPCCIGAPYCGPPPDPVFGGYSNVYVFLWTTTRDDPSTRNYSLEQFSREHAAQRAGIEEVAALPTGLYMIDMRVCGIVPPPWFAYEWGDPPYNSRKGSTEDVYFTRNASLLGVPQFCNWDSWAGHAKPEMVGKPVIIGVNNVGETLREAWASGRRSDQVVRSMQAEDLVVGEPMADDKAGYPAGNGQPGQTPAPVQAPAHSEAFRIVQRRYGLGLGEICPDGKVRFNTADDELELLSCLVRTLAARFPDRPLNILEIGSWVGESARALYAGLGDAGGTVWCVDTWKGSVHDISGFNSLLFGTDELRKLFDENTRGLKIVPLQMTSMEATRVKELPSVFDLIFIDGNHNKEYVTQDIETWMPRVHGILAGHNYDRKAWPDVTTAVDSLVGRVKLRREVWFTRVVHGEPIGPDDEWSSLSQPEDKEPEVEVPARPATPDHPLAERMAGLRGKEVVTRDAEGHFHTWLQRGETHRMAMQRMPPPEFEGQEYTIHDPAGAPA